MMVLRSAMVVVLRRPKTFCGLEIVDVVK